MPSTAAIMQTSDLSWGLSGEGQAGIARDLAYWCCCQITSRCSDSASIQIALAYDLDMAYLTASSLQLVPSRESFFEKLDVEGEAGMEEMNQFLKTFLPVLNEIQNFMKAHDLDDPTPV